MCFTRRNLSARTARCVKPIIALAVDTRPPLLPIAFALTGLKGRHYNRTGGGRLAQRESACFTRKRPLVRIQYRPPVNRRCAEVAEWQTRCVQGAVSERACGFKSHLRHHGKLLGATWLAPTLRARSSVWIERSPAEAEVVGSSPAERAIACPPASELLPGWTAAFRPASSLRTCETPARR